MPRCVKGRVGRTDFREDTHSCQPSEREAGVQGAQDPSANSQQMLWAEGHNSGLKCPWACYPSDSLFKVNKDITKPDVQSHLWKECEKREGI